MTSVARLTAALADRYRIERELGAGGMATVTLSLAIAYDAVGRYAEATPLYDHGLVQSPEAWYGWGWKIGHKLALGNTDAAIDALGKFVVQRLKYPVLSERLTRELRDPATRDRAVDALSRSDLMLSIPFFRWWRGDEATIAMLQASVRSRKTNLAIGLDGATLGTTMISDPRVQAIAVQLDLPRPDSARSP